MSDQPDTSILTPALEERLSAVVTRLQAQIVASPRFRPSDPALAADYDKYVADMLQSLVEIAAAAAVDKANIQMAIELAGQRKAHAERMEELRSNMLATNRANGIPFPVKAPAS